MARRFDDLRRLHRLVCSGSVLLLVGHVTMDDLSLPFLRISRMVSPPRNHGKEQPDVTQSPSLAAPSNEHDLTQEVGFLFDAAVTSVQKRFTHLSKADIAHPPHQWFDAALARQIAVHVMVDKLKVPRRRLALELQRNREQLHRAMKVIDGRLDNPEFSGTYEDIASDTLEIIKQKRKANG